MTILVVCVWNILELIHFIDKNRMHLEKINRMTGNDYFLHFFAEQIVLFKPFIFQIDFSQHIRKRHAEILIIKLFYCNLSRVKLNHFV